MNNKNHYARRYHWLNENVKDFTENPHKAVCGMQEQKVLNLVSKENQASRLASVEVSREEPNQVKNILMTLSIFKPKREIGPHNN